MKKELLGELLEITAEEQEILLKQKIAKEVYTSQADFIIEGKRFLQDHPIVVRKHTRFVKFPKHKHDYIEINYVYHGQLTQTVGKETLHLKQGELLFLNQHIEHEIEPCATEDIIINFIIEPSFFEFIFSFFHSDNMLSHFLVNSLYNQTQKGHFLYFKVAKVNNIQELTLKIIHEIMNPTFMSDSTIKLYIGLLFIELIKHSDKVESKQEQTSHHRLVVDALKYIEANYRHASLYELSNQLHQPHYLLSKMIKKATSHTFIELLQERRLSKARELLETSHLPVTAIVEKVGYDNMSYFYRIFKQKYGQTPRKYRENNS